MKLSFLKLPTDERGLYIEQAAIQRNVSPVIMEKDFWVCWLLNILFESEFAGSLVFKGGTSLSKVFGAINRFSEDIDLSLSPTFLKLSESEIISRTQGAKWMKNAESVCEVAVGTKIMPALEASVVGILGNERVWFEYLKDPITNSPVLLFHYPSSQPTGFDYIKRSVKLEFGSLTEQQPTGRYSITPWIAEIFPQAFPDWQCEVVALEIERSFWEKATILHAEYHRPSDKLRDRYSRHYADTAMLAKRPETIKAISNLDLLNKVVLWKSKFFSSAWANFDLAKPGTFRLVPQAERLPALRRDYQLMRDMYLAEPVSFDDIISILSDLEDRINLISESQKVPPENELSQPHLASLPSLEEVLTKKRGNELVQSVREILAAGASVNDISLNGHRPLQLLIRANLEPRKKLELVKSIIELGADVHSADRSGLTPYQVAIVEGNKDVSDFLRYKKKVRPMSPPGTGYAQHYKLYGEIPLP